MSRLTNNGRASVLGAVALAAALAVASGARANPEVYQRTVRSTAWVISLQEGVVKSTGTGVLIDVERKLVLTNYHVVADRPEVCLFFPSFDNNNELVVEPKQYVENVKGMGIKGKVIQTNQKSDLAIIEAERLPRGIKAVALAAKSPSPGQRVHAIGNSGVEDGALWRYIKGDVRQVYRKKFKVGDPSGMSFQVTARVVETDAATNPGDSGGPVVNDKGELVAITESYSNGQRLVSSSIDVSEVRTLLAEVGKAKPKDIVKVPEKKPQPRPEPKPAPKPAGKGNGTSETARPQESMR
jgi:S1-C subfamily serine protease